MDFSQDLKISESDVEQLKNIWMGWIDTVSKMTPTKVEEIKKERLKVSTEFFAGKSKRECPSTPDKEPLQVLEEMIDLSLLSIGATAFPPKLKTQICTEMGSFFHTGNCEMIREDKVCINPTFLEPGTEEWRVHYMSCPYEGYPPFHVEQLNNSAPNGVLLHYCQKVLTNLLNRYKQQEQQVNFHFYLGDALQLCYHQPERFNVIDTSNLSDHVGLANLLNATRNALIDHPTSILRTESMTWTTLASSLSEYVETALCVPVPIFPSVYGLRLLNSVGLGSCKPFDIHRLVDSTAVLKWQISPIYEDVQFNLSSELKAGLASLKSRCFFLPEMDPTPKERTAMKSYTPLTYGYIVQSLIESCPFSASDMEWLLSPELLPPFSLTWRAFTDWVEGRPVCHAKAVIHGALVSYKLERSKSLGAPALRLAFIPNEDSLCYMMPKSNPLQKRASLHTFIQNVHYIDNLEFQPKRDRKGDIESLTVSFYLPLNHGLEGTHQIFVINVTSNDLVMCLGSLQDFFRSKILQERPPFDAVNRRQLSPASDSLLKVDHCLEFNYHYEIQVSILGRKSPSGLRVSVDQTVVCHSGHRITISLTSPKTLKPLVLTLPWPVAGDLKATLRKSQRSIQLSVKKAIYEPWPCDFTTPSKLATDSMEEWEKCDIGDEYRHFGNHLLMQFPFRERKTSEEDLKAGVAISTPLNELREIIRCLFIGSTVQGRKFFALRKKNQQADSPDWFLRVHLPIRVSPEGSPLLHVTAVDDRRTEKLIALGELDGKQAEEDFARIRQAEYEVMHILMQTDEEARLLRYMLRLNSTRITPNSWEAKYLSDNSEGSWMPTFVCPLYVDHPGSLEDFMLFSKSVSDLSATPPAANSPKLDGDNVCSRCRSTSGQLKRCASCKKVKYCSVQCQRADWSQHKVKCSA